MKKLLSLVLVLAVVLSSMSFAFAAPSDLAGYKYADAVNKLVGLGVINGYPDGTFKPTGNITRAEFAKVVVMALGYGDAAVAAGDAKFTDCVGHWAVGFINVASAKGIVNGVGNGKFNPDANVKYEEAVTMIVRSLGYEPAAKANGGYPNGYLTIASQEKITKDVAMVAGTIADRGTVAKLLAESLEVPFLVQKGYGTLTTFEKDASQNLMKTGLKLTKYDQEVIVDSFNATDKTITFTGYAVDNKKTVKYVDPIDPTGTKNCKVTVWYKDGTIYSFKNDTTIKIDRLKKVNGTDSTTSADVATTFLKKVELQNGGSFDTERNSNDTAHTSAIKTADSDFSGNVSDLIGDYAKVYLKDNKIFRIETFDLGTAGLIAEATATKIKFQNYGNNDVYLSNIDTNTDLLYVFIDGAEKSVTDLKEGMYFQSAQIAAKKLVIAASTAKVEGKLTAFETNKATIGGSTYDTVGNNVSGTDNYISYNNGTKYDKNTPDDLVSIDVTGYKNFQNKIAFLKGTATSSTSDFWAVIKSIKVEGKALTVVRDVNGVSTEVEYAVKTDSDENKGAAGYTPWATIAAFGAGDMTLDTAAAAANRIYKFTINSENKITKIRTVAQASGAFAALTPGQVSKFNKDSGKVENTQVAHFYGDSATVIDLTGAKVKSWNDIKDRAVAGAHILYSLDTTNNTKANVIVFINDTFKTVNSTEKFYAFVTGESFDGTYYNITTSDGATLKLHKDYSVAASVYSLKQMNRNFITYIKDGDNIRVKAVAAAVYDSGTFSTAIGIGDIYDEGNSYTTVSASTFTKVDGDYVVIGGTYYRKASDIKVIRITWKANPANGIDTSVMSDATSIAANKDVLVIRDSDNSVRAIYYVQ